MKDSLEAIITSLVNNPSEVSINEIDGEKYYINSMNYSYYLWRKRKCKP